MFSQRDFQADQEWCTLFLALAAVAWNAASVGTRLHKSMAVPTNLQSHKMPAWHLCGSFG